MGAKLVSQPGDRAWLAAAGAVAGPLCLDRAGEHWAARDLRPVPLLGQRHRLAGLWAHRHRRRVHRPAARPGAQPLGGRVWPDRLRAGHPLGPDLRRAARPALLLAVGGLLVWGIWLHPALAMPEEYFAAGENTRNCLKNVY